MSYAVAMLALLLYVTTQPSSTAGIITAIAAVFTALGGAMGGAAVLITVLRTKQQVTATAATVATVHTIVNQQKTDADRFNIALSEYGLALGALLDAAGIPHPAEPVDQSKPVTGRGDAQPGQPTG